MCHQLKIKCELVFTHCVQQAFATVHIVCTSWGSREIYHIFHRSWKPGTGMDSSNGFSITLRKTLLLLLRPENGWCLWVKESNSNDTRPSYHSLLNHSSWNPCILVYAAVIDWPGLLSRSAAQMQEWCNSTDWWQLLAMACYISVSWRQIPTNQWWKEPSPFVLV